VFKTGETLMIEKEDGGLAHGSELFCVDVESIPNVILTKLFSVRKCNRNPNFTA
jgi:hypothetical protein